MKNDPRFTAREESGIASSLAIDGLIGGLETADLINSLMNVEQIAQLLFKYKTADPGGFGVRR